MSSRNLRANRRENIDAKNIHASRQKLPLKHRDQLDERKRDQGQARAVASFHEWWQAVIRKAIKDRSHRMPDQAKVSAELARLDREVFVGPLLKRLLEIESEYGKPYCKFVPEERRTAALAVASYFSQMRAELDRGKGRPSRKQKGIVNSAIRDSAVFRASQVNHRKDLLRSLVSFAAGTRLGVFSNAERRTGDLEAVKDYAVSFDLIDDISNVRSNSRAVRNFIAAHGLDERRQVRYEKYLSRNESAVLDRLNKFLSATPAGKRTRNPRR